MKFKLFTLPVGLVSLSLLVLVNLSCSEDSSTGPGITGASGTIIFENAAAWPDSGDVQITIWGENVWSAFGPVGPPAAVVTLTKVPGQSQYEYSFEAISAGPYSAISVGWRFPDANARAECRSVVLGVYLNDPNTVSTGLVIQGTAFAGPLPVVVTVEDGKTLSNLDIKADFGIMPAYINGLLNGVLQCGV